MTDAADGIGEAVARTLAKHGASVFAVDTPDSDVEEYFRPVRGVTGHAASLTDPLRMAVLVETGIDCLGGLDIVVADFPLTAAAPIDSGGSVLDELLDRRTTLVTSLVRAALPPLKKSPSGRIVSVGFLRSLFAARAREQAALAERRLAALTRALAAETGKFGITVNYIQPGAVMTSVSRETFRKDPAFRDHCLAHCAARRLGEPVDVAKVVLFLVSDDAAFVSGTGIAVDGGRTDVQVL